MHNLKLVFTTSKKIIGFLSSTTGFMFVCLLVFVFESNYLLNIIFNQNLNLKAAVLPSVLVTETNQKRTELALPVLNTNPLLVKAAEMKVADMASRGYFSHDTPEGKQPWYWLDQVGYLYKFAGENLAVNFKESSEVTEAWMNSPSHRSNILKSTYTEIGIATKVGTYKGKEAIFVVQFFGTPIEPKSLSRLVPTKTEPRLLQNNKQEKSTSVLKDNNIEKVLGEDVVKGTPSTKKSSFDVNNILFIIALFVLFLFITQSILDRIQIGSLIRSLILVGIIIYLVYLNEKVFPQGVISVIEVYLHTV